MENNIGDYGFFCYLEDDYVIPYNQKPKKRLCVIPSTIIEETIMEENDDWTADSDDDGKLTNIEIELRTKQLVNYLDKMIIFSISFAATIYILFKIQ